MPVSIFASTNVPANNVPADGTRTDGLIARGSGAQAVANPFSGQSVPAEFLEGSGDASIDRVNVTNIGNDGFVQVELGGSTRRDFLSAIEASIGIAWQDGNGNTQKLLLSEVGGDTIEPYYGTATGKSLAGLSGTLTVVIVDTTDPNVDWANLEFATDNQSSPESDSLQIEHAVRTKPSETEPEEPTEVAWSDGTVAAWGAVTATWGDGGDRAGAILNIGRLASDSVRLTHTVRATVPVEVEGANVSGNLAATHEARAAAVLKVGRVVSESVRLTHATRSDAAVGIGLDSDSVRLSHEVRASAADGLIEITKDRLQLTHAARAAATIKIGETVSGSSQRTHDVRGAGDPGVGIDQSESVRRTHAVRASGPRTVTVGSHESHALQLTHDVRAPDVVGVGRYVSGAAIRTHAVKAAAPLAVEGANVGESGPQRTHAVRSSAASVLGVGLDSDSVRFTHEVRAPDAVGVGRYVSGALQLEHVVRAPTEQIIELATDESHSLQLVHETRSVPTGTIILGVGVHVSASLRLTHDLMTTTEDLPLVYDHPPIDHPYSTVWLRNEFASKPRTTGPWVEGEQTVKIKRRTAERAEVSVTMLMHTGADFRANRPVRGDNFEIRNGNDLVLEQVEADGLDRLDSGEYPLFKGKVLTAPWNILPGGNLARIQVRAQSLMARLDEIRVAPRWVSPAGALNVVLPQLLSRFVPVTEGITWPAATLTDAGYVNETVHDHASVADAVEALVEQGGGGVFGVDAFGRFYSRPRNAVQNTTVVLDKSTVLDETVSGSDDVQHHQTVTTVIGATVQAGEKREDFYGDGATQRWRLRFRISRIKNVSLDGVQQATSGEGARFTIDADTGWITDGGSNPLTGDGESGQLLSVLYDWNFPIVETVESAAGIARYGRIHKVTQDATADTIERGQDKAQALNRRHDNPTSRMQMSTIPGAVFLLREATIALVNLPKLGIGDERWMIDGVDHTIHFGSEEVHEFDLDLLLRDHESSGRAYWRRGGRIVVPTQPEVGQLVTAGDGEAVSPEIIAQEGLRLPKPLGGRDTARYYGAAWEDIAGYADAVLDAQRLPSNLVEWAAMAKMAGPNQSGQVRLVNANTGAQVGGAVTVTSVTPIPISVSRITLTPNRNRYRLQHRYVSGPTSGRGRGISTWAGNIDVGS